jgi:hypothetical protein
MHIVGSSTGIIDLGAQPLTVPIFPWLPGLMSFSAIGEDRRRTADRR